MTKTEKILSTLASYEDCEIFCQKWNPSRIDKNTLIVIRIGSKSAEVIHHGTPIFVFYQGKPPMLKTWPSRSTIRRQNAILSGKPLHIKQGIIHYNNIPLDNYVWYSLGDSLTLAYEVTR